MTASPLPPRGDAGASRHGRAADALITSYLRELLADEDQPSVPPRPRAPLDLVAQPATARGRSAPTDSR